MAGETGPLTPAQLPACLHSLVPERVAEVGDLRLMLEADELLDLGEDGLAPDEHLFITV
jgi:hypothetical protein